MTKQLKQLTGAMFAILDDPRASRIERIEAGKIIAAVAGILLPDTSECFLSQKQAVQLRQAKQRIVEKVLRQKEVRKRQNRRSYLRKKLKALEANQQENNGN